MQSSSGTALAVPTLAQIEAEITRREVEREQGNTAEAARASFASFFRLGWHVIEPDTPLTWNWHIDAICKHLEAVTQGEIRWLLINMPPGHLKSRLISVYWPAWVWLHRPGFRAIFGSYAMDLARRDSMWCRDLVQSSWYRDTFRPDWEMSPHQNTKDWFENTAGGGRLALAVGGKGAGFRGHAVIFDDPLNVKARPSAAELDTAAHWWFKRMSSRFNDPRDSIRVGVMQRLHEDDPSGHILRRGGYTHLNLPTEFNPEKKCETKIGWSDPRTKRGELLFDGMYPIEVVNDAKIDLGEYDFAAQHNQEPVPIGGGMIKEHWWRYWYPEGVEEPAPVRIRLESGEVFECEQVKLPAADQMRNRITSWDMTFKGNKGNDRVSGTEWATSGANAFLLDAIVGIMSFTKALKACDTKAGQMPDAIAHLVEDKANGPAIVDTLRSKVPGMLEVTPLGGKEARCAAVSPLIESGNVYLPHPAYCEWTTEFRAEVSGFPFARYDDQTDSSTQALNWLRPRMGRTYKSRRV